MAHRGEGDGVRARNDRGNFLRAEPRLSQTYREDRYFCVAMHLQIIGRPSRIALLEELITCDQVAHAVRPALRAEAWR